MNIEIRDFKPHFGLSEETIAFVGTLYIDGEACGTVKNDGHGGPNCFSDADAEKRINDHYCGQTMRAHGYDLPLTADFQVSLLVDKLVKDSGFF